MWSKCEQNILKNVIETTVTETICTSPINDNKRENNGHKSHGTKDFQHISTIAGSLVSIGTVAHTEVPQEVIHDAGYDTEHTSSFNSDDFDEGELRRELLRDKWKLLYDMFDPEGFGEITVDEFIKALKSPEFISQVPMNKRELLMERAKKSMIPFGTGYVTFQDFVNVMTGKRTRSFKCAVHQRDREVCSENDFQLILQEPPFFHKMVTAVALEILPEERDRKYYTNRYTCCPPPWFITIITIIELTFFIIHTLCTDSNNIGPIGPVPIYSLFIYRPDKRHELWRFISYMFLHAGWFHLSFNLLIQLMFGLPLEMVHGSGRIAFIYMIGVLAGSLGTSIMDPEVYLAGASSGVYALLSAHLANVMINYHQMSYSVLRLAIIFLLASLDVGFAVYSRFVDENAVMSFIGPLAGSVAGLTIGLVILQNFEQNLNGQLLWWIMLGIYFFGLTFAIIFNIVNSSFVQNSKKQPIYVTETFYNGFHV